MTSTATYTSSFETVRWTQEIIFPGVATPRWRHSAATSSVPLRVGPLLRIRPLSSATTKGCGRRRELPRRLKFHPTPLAREHFTMILRVLPKFMHRDYAGHMHG